MKTPFVISISGISGSGKTTIAKALKNRLTSAEIVHFDDIAGDWLGRDYCEWSEAGANCNEAKLLSTINAIDDLMHKPLDYIILDYPFGKAHHGVGAYINFSTWIDIPIDVSLARYILRDYTRRSKARRPLTGAVVDEISSYLDFYLERHRNTYFRHVETVRPSCDLIVDGLKSPEVIVAEILSNVSRCEAIMRL